MVPKLRLNKKPKQDRFLVWCGLCNEHLTFIGVNALKREMSHHDLRDFVFNTIKSIEDKIYGNKNEYFLDCIPEEN